jgi:hypothetical protein
MAFSEIELKYIQNLVGRVCKRRSPPHLSDKIRTTYEITNHDVVIFEERPGFNKPDEWSKMPSAKFKYDRANKKWKLYWMRRDEKWHLYHTDTKSTELERLIAEVDRDPYGAFFG